MPGSTDIGERGASAVEYGLLIAGIAALIAVAVFAFGGSVGGLFGGTCQEMINAGGQSHLLIGLSPRRAPPHPGS